MKTFSVAYISGRDEPHLDWFRDSLRRECDRFGLDFEPQIIVVDALAHFRLNPAVYSGTVHALPKPSIWQGKYRITKEDWFAVANARNTAICLCETEWVCFFDDRCVLMPGYLDALQAAMEVDYVMVGAYEKRERIAVENGIITKKGFVSGDDCREKYILYNKIEDAFPCPGGWCFGANFACPVEWILEMNGAPELCDGMGFEDVQTGLLLEHNGHALKYDTRAKIVQDRTEGKIGPVYRREDKGLSPNDKSHALLAMFTKPEVKKAMHVPGWDIDLRHIRADILSGKSWPVPPNIEYLDFYDQQPIRDFK